MQIYRGKVNPQARQGEHSSDKKPIGQALVVNSRNLAKIKLCCKLKSHKKSSTSHVVEQQTYGRRCSDQMRPETFWRSHITIYAASHSEHTIPSMKHRGGSIILCE
ncbi:hypothetical protein ILYODFUR_017407 [Ilyodon furcidens]|uniref:Uncharacterized protein n=1 Tax=Ilyodon furcidens TaxID=33524 RepID=A0ABV0TJP2_9TELE